MARNTNFINIPHSPPAIAIMLISLLVLPKDKSAILGDMAEEFQLKGRLSSKQARAWYWQQTTRSLPYLILKRLQSSPIKNAISILGATIIAYFLILMWDIYVARFTARLVAVQPDAPPLLMIRIIYFITLMVGVAIIGGLIAKLTFQKHRRFIKNAFIYLSPIVLTLFVVSVVSMIKAGHSLQPLYFIVRIGISTFALVMGAKFAHKPICKT